MRHETPSLQCYRLCRRPLDTGQYNCPRQQTTTRKRSSLSTVALETTLERGGGSGAAIVFAHAHLGQVRLAWAGSVTLGNARTTNNVAEYRSLLCGLRAARAKGITSIIVVGDSQLIPTQLQWYRVPRNPRLRRLYLLARQLNE